MGNKLPDTCSKQPVKMSCGSGQRTEEVAEMTHELCSCPSGNSALSATDLQHKGADGVSHEAFFFQEEKALSAQQTVSQMRGEISGFFYLPGPQCPACQALLSSVAQQCRSRMRVRQDLKRKCHEALKVHSPACSSMPSALMLGDDVTRAFECVKSQCLTKHLLTKEKLTSGAAGKVWYQECLGF